MKRFDLNYLLNKKKIEMNFSDIMLLWGICSVINLVIFIMMGLW